MGRYTTVQSYSDNNPNVSSIPYAIASGSNRLPIDSEKSRGLKVERVNNVCSSSAGAGSSDFHIYRGFRRIEMARVKNMEEEGKRLELEREFQQKRLYNLLEDEQRTAKRAAKRQKRKERKKQAKLRTSDVSGEEKSGEEHEEHEENAENDQENEGNPPHQIESVDAEHVQPNEDDNRV